MPFFRGKQWAFWRGRESQMVETVTAADFLLGCVEKLLHPIKAITANADAVWPELFIGDIYTAENITALREHGFTHILNCAHKPGFDIKPYKDADITYKGIAAQDIPSYDMSTHFGSSAEFIHSALMGGGRILVHCHAGVSRSATIVLAYLMLKQNMTLMKAINTVKEKRGIAPNRGFLRQLIDLHIRLYEF